MYKVLSAHVEIVGREVEIPIGSPDRGASGLKAEASLVSMVESLSEVVGAAMAECHWPTIIGGDCSVLLGALLGERLAGESAGLLFVDGHEDAWPPHDSLTGEAADCELGLAPGHVSITWNPWRPWTITRESTSISARSP